ncbi:MAG: RNA polymerase sigma factor [Isosphaeraceae bacterium]
MGPRKAASQHLRVLYDVGTMGDLSDGQLLERFATREGEAAELAFAVLVEKHGPMVLRACRSILKDDHAAQDAFQATFLVLVRKARGLWVRDSLGPWLHQVALRVASRSRLEAARRRAVEVKAAGLALRGSAVTDTQELGEVIHREIDALPDGCRSAVVLCCLEGLSLDQAARRLGWPMGTVQSRLARGRQRLRDRLARRGLSPTASTAGLALASERAMGAGLPAALAESTTKAALHVAAGQAMAGVVPASVIVLVEGVLKTMQFPIAKAALAAVLLIGGMAAGAASLVPGPQDGGKSSALSRNVGIGPATEAHPADTAHVVGMPLPAEGQTIEILVTGPGKDKLSMIIRADGKKGFFVEKHVTNPNGNVNENFNGTADQVLGRYSNKSGHDIAIDLPGDGQRLVIRAEGPEKDVQQLTVWRQGDGTYSTQRQANFSGAMIDEKMISNASQIGALLRFDIRPPDQAKPTDHVDASSRIEYKYLPVGQGQAALTYYSTALHLEGKAHEGWEFCGGIDMLLTEGEYQALRDGSVPPPANDKPAATYKVLVFKRARVTAH